MIAEIIHDIILDGIKLLPFLFLTYLAMEYIEHKTSEKTRQIMLKSGKFGPIFGGIFGIIPQCGFSTAASNLYAGRIITVGTLLAVFLSTSDEMLPVFVSQQASFHTVSSILATKAVIGIIAGYLTDMFLKKRKRGQAEGLRIEQMCGQHHCHCSEKRIWKPALGHTLQIFVFILMITFMLNFLIGLVGEDNLAALIRGRAVMGPLFAGMVGLIPNCASSVILAELYLEGILGVGSMLAGLLAGSGVGLLVLYRVNHDLRENIKITALLYVVGVASGIFVEMTGILGA